MVNYRLNISEGGYTKYRNWYKNHLDAYGGIFTPDKRRKLLGINPKNPQAYEDTPNFWADVRNTVRNGLIDLQLICEIAHPKQLKKIFEYTLPSNEEKSFGFSPPEGWDTFTPNLTTVVSKILSSVHYEKDREGRLWRADLATRLVDTSIGFFDGETNLIRSPVNQRYLKDVRSILEFELSYYK